MNWTPRLPSGASYGGRNARGFQIQVSVPVDEAGMSPCVCPDDPQHRFKLALQAVEGAGAETMYCPYCGRQADPHMFMPQQMARARAAMEQAAAQYMHAELDRILRNAFGRSSASRRSGITWEYKPSRPPRVRPLPTYEVEPTRRSMTCGMCDSTFAVYSLATYCPCCGRLAPAQQFTGLVQLERDRICVFDALPEDQRLAAGESGLITTTYEAAIKNGFGALETYLKEWFTRDATGVTKQPPSTTFQRLDDANALFKQHLGINLETAAGPDAWQAMQRAAALRHVLTHNAGVIDQKFLDQMQTWHQTLGQRLNITEQDALDVLDALEQFAVGVLPGTDPAS